MSQHIKVKGIRRREIDTQTLSYVYFQIAKRQVQERREREEREKQQRREVPHER